MMFYPFCVGIREWNWSTATHSSALVDSSSPKGDRAERRLQLFDTASGEEIASTLAQVEIGAAADPTVPNPVFVAAAWDPGGREILTLSDGVRFWDAATLRALDRYPSSAASAMAISDDGSKIAIGAVDGSLRVYSRAGEVEASFLGHSNRIRGLAFGPHDTALASISDDGDLALWDLPRGRRRGAATLAKGRYAIAFSHDGSRIAVGGSDEVVRLFDTATCLELVALHGHVARISVLAFGPKDEFLMSACSDGTIRLWDAPSDSLHGMLPR